MKAIVAYSKPRGIYGIDYIFTIVADFNNPPEQIEIQVWGAGGNTYSCHSCGHFATVRVEEELITSVMEDRKITINELLLQPVKQPALEEKLSFIDGELKYL